ncbi:MAG: hypothetical protein HGA71_08465 [Azonexaceae bacterium]|nr:hypothetical protein [Azonexaceae bacterium]
MKKIIEINVGGIQLPSFYIRNQTSGLFEKNGVPAASLPDGITQEQLAEEYAENLHWLSFHGAGCDLAYSSNGKWTVIEALPGEGLQIHGSIEKGKSIIPDIVKRAGLIEIAKSVYANPNDPQVAQLLLSDVWLNASPDEKIELASEMLMGNPK